MGSERTPSSEPDQRRSFQRRPTRTVLIGEVTVGSDHPLRVQSMTNTPTRDVEATTAQIARLAAAGCEIARIAVATRRDLEALPQLREQLRELDVTLPLVADIHFSPQLAVAAAPWVEKIRINPGNYGEQRRWQRELTDAEYRAELVAVSERLQPLVEALQRSGRSLRIGSNHGSLSSRVLQRWGDTPQGMVAGALEYVEACEQLGFRDIIISMKASSSRVMIAAYRLLCQQLTETGRDYPLHLGVTEAGQGRDGVIRSAVGIGSLLLDGIGDTIRVSLTDAPEVEIAPARAMIETLQTGSGGAGEQPVVATPEYSLSGRRDSSVIQIGDIKIGGDWPPVVSAPALEAEVPLPEFTTAADKLPTLTGYPDQTGDRVLWPAAELAAWRSERQPRLLEVVFSAGLPETELAEFRRLRLPPDRTLIAVETEAVLADNRRLAEALPGYPLDIYFGSTCTLSEIAIAMHGGALLTEGVGDSLTILAPVPAPAALAFNILQGSGRRVTRAEYISCPGCGRTQFDLLEATRQVKASTAHLTGVKIAVMGCVVNGPGEMADADFGYVGSGADQVDLYRSGTPIKQGVPAAEGPRELIRLIQASGRWREPAAGTNGGQTASNHQKQ